MKDWDRNWMRGLIRSISDAKSCRGNGIILDVMREALPRGAEHGPRMLNFDGGLDSGREVASEGDYWAYSGIGLLGS
jgi:hypothetical protein